MDNTELYPPNQKQNEVITEVLRKFYYTIIDGMNASFVGKFHLLQDIGTFVNVQRSIVKLVVPVCCGILRSNMVV